MTTKGFNHVVQDGCGWLVISSGKKEFLPYKTYRGNAIDCAPLGEAIANETGATVYFYDITIKPSNIVEPQKTSYSEYILSPEWRLRATEAKELAGWRCQVCNRHRDEVVLDAHHRTYERLGNEQPEDITVLCRDCHALYESNKKNGRRS